MYLSFKQKSGFTKGIKQKISVKVFLPPLNGHGDCATDLDMNHKKVNEEIKSFNRKIAGKENKLNKTPEEKNFIEFNREKRDLLVKYNDTISDITKANEKYQIGEGIFFYSPQELIKRFELLGGSLAAGNNGVLHEYIQIAHRLKDLGLVTNKQLNKLLRNYINIR